MPLVVPGVNSTSGDKAEEWQNKLIGKKLSDDEASTETVRFNIKLYYMFLAQQHDANASSNRCLPSEIFPRRRALSSPE